MSRFLRVVRSIILLLFVVLSLVIATIWVRSHYRTDVASAATRNGRAWEFYSGGGAFSFSTHTPGPQQRPFDWQAIPRKRGNLPTTGETVSSKILWAPLGGWPAAVADETFIAAPTAVWPEQPYHLSFAKIDQWRRLGVSGAYGPAELSPSDDPYLWKFPRTLGRAAYWSVSVPYRVAFIAAALPAGALLALGWVGRRARARRLARGLCRQCGYDLRATPGRCPECGTSAAPT